MDFEASGFGSLSVPIEVGYCLTDQTKYCALIKPHHSWSHWDIKAEALHGISLELLNDVGREPKLVCEELNEKLSGKTLYSDAWVADKAWLNVLFNVTPYEPSFKLRAVENAQSECQHLIWDEVRQKMLAEHYFKRHRASADAQFIQQVYQRSSQLCLGIDRKMQSMC